MFQRNLSVIVGAAAVVAGVAWAEPTVEFENGPGDTQGGIYIAMADQFGTFDTFCLQRNEGLSFDFLFEYTIDTEIKFMDDGGTNPLDAETAYLYVQFRQDNIRDILGKPGLPEEDLANAVQLAIWFLEEGYSIDNPDALTLAQHAEDAVDSGQWSGLGDVRVMNVWNQGHVGDPLHSKQDVLVIIPAPAPAALAAVGLFRALRRRR